jgi:hypothetical protein
LAGIYDIMNEGTIGGFVLMIFLVLIWVIHVFYSERKKYRPLPRFPVFDTMEELIGRSAEMGRGAHFNLGYYTQMHQSYNLGGLAGLALADHVAGLCAKYDVNLTVDTPDPAYIPYIAEMMKSAWGKEGKEIDPFPNILYYSGEYFAYALGGMGAIYRLQPGSIFILGHAGSEIMTFMDAGYTIGAGVVAGSRDGSTNSWAVCLADHYMLSNEVMIADAFVGKDLAAIGSIGATDVSMLALIVFLSITFIASLLGYIGLYNFLGA